MADRIDHRRRRVLGRAAMMIAAARLGVLGSADARPADASGPNALRPPASFGPLKQIDAGVLSIGYAEAGPRDGPAVILLHGWPYDIHSYVEVAPLLAKAADGSAYARMGTGKHSHRILEGIGHNVPQEAPEAFARAVLDVDRH